MAHITKRKKKLLEKIAHVIASSASEKYFFYSTWKIFSMGLELEISS